jgi:hypothetical protein
LAKFQNLGEVMLRHGNYLGGERIFHWQKFHSDDVIMVREGRN